MSTDDTYNPYLYSDAERAGFSGSLNKTSSETSLNSSSLDFDAPLRHFEFQEKPARAVPSTTTHTYTANRYPGYPSSSLEQLIDQRNSTPVYTGNINGRYVLTVTGMLLLTVGVTMVCFVLAVI